MDELMWQDSTILDTVAMVSRTCSVASEPLPYELRNDDTITLLLLAGFILVAIAFGHMRRFVVLQLRDLFYLPTNGTISRSLSPSQLRLQLLLVMHTCVMFALLTYHYSSSHAHFDNADTAYPLMGVCLASFVVYFILHTLLYVIVNGVFFDRHRSREWLRFLLFITSIEGVLLFPIALAAVYHDISPSITLCCVLCVVGLVKMIQICRCYAIFFSRSGGFLRLVLYLCTLEAIPLFVMWTGLMYIGDNMYLND